MPNAREVTLVVDGVTTRFEFFNPGWVIAKGFGRNSYYNPIEWGSIEEVILATALNRIAADAQTISNLTIELETARAEMNIYRTQRDQVSAETTIDEERFERLFKEAQSGWHPLGPWRFARRLLSRYLAEMTGTKPARDLHDVPQINLGDDTP